MSEIIYKKMYTVLFNDVAKVIEDLKSGQKPLSQIIEDLQKSHQKTEQIFIDNDESDD